MKKMACWTLAALIPVAGWAGMRAGPIAGPQGQGGISFAGQASLGMLNGEGKEHVYDYETADGSRRQLSRLDWDLKDVAMGGGSFSLRVLERLTLNAGMWVALSEGSGEMDDYDWMDVGSTDWTHYSLSDVELTMGYVLDMNAGWDVFKGEGWRATVLAGYKRDGWEWEDSGVYLLYPDYNYVPQFLDGENMVNYEQEFQMPYVGIDVEATVLSIGTGAIAGNLGVSAYLNYAPYIWATDWDEHVQRDLHFEETFEGGEMLGLGAEVRYDFTQGGMNGLFLTAAVDYQKIDLIVGDMEVVNIVTGETGGGEDVAGIENEYLVISLGGGIRF
jgi:plasminogen activator